VRSEHKKTRGGLLWYLGLCAALWKGTINDYITLQAYSRTASCQVTVGVA
jgi:hypothetical protein